MADDTHAGRPEPRGDPKSVPRRQGQRANGPHRTVLSVEGVLHQLERYISDGRYTPGERLGAERELAVSMGVSRTLLRRALDRLESEGLVRRVIGRNGGLFRADGKVHRTLDNISAVPAYLREQGYVSRSTVLRAALTTADPEEARALLISTGDPIYTIRRVRFADEVPFSLEHARIPARMFPGLLQRPLDRSLYQIMWSTYGSEPSIAHEQIESMTISDPATASLLHVDPGATGLLVRRITLDRDRRPIEFAHDLFRADRTRLEVTVNGLHKVVIPIPAPS